MRNTSFCHINQPVIDATEISVSSDFIKKFFFFFFFFFLQINKTRYKHFSSLQTFDYFWAPFQENVRLTKWFFFCNCKMKAFQKCNGNATDNWKAENASFTFLLLDIELMFQIWKVLVKLRFFTIWKKYILEKIKMDCKYLLFTKQKNR